MQNKNLSGYLLAFITVSIWTGWMIITRYGVKTNLTPLDITFLRFTTAGILFFPLAIKNRKQIFKIPKTLLALMLLGAGAPYVLVSAIGFRHAPASHGILIPGTMPLWVALLSRILFKEKFSVVRMIGYGLILLGILFKLSLSLQQGFSWVLVDGYFLFAAILWSFYTVTNRAAKLDALSATAWVTSGSAFFLLFPYLYYQHAFPHHLDLKGSILQIFYQGILTSIVSLITYNFAIEKIGASKTSAFAALVPVMVTLLAYPLLNEKPTLNDLFFVACMTLGVLFASNLISKRNVSSDCSI